MHSLSLPRWLTDVSCECASFPAMLEGSTASGALWQAAPGRFLLDIPDVARFRVEAGRRISIDPAPGADAAELERCLRMTPLAALLYQRGALVFHAAAAAHAGGAVLLAGDSGAGKSELLACLADRDWTILTDDLAVVDFDAAGSLCVWPISPEIMLWRSAETGPNTDGAADRQRHTMTAPRFSQGPLPLHSVYRLMLHSQDNIEIGEIQGVDRFRIAGVLAYNSRIAAALQDRGEHFRRAMALARNTPMCRLLRPRSRQTVEELAARIIARELS